MSFVSAWILSIAGVVVVGVIIDLILPDGQMTKYIKGVVAIITVLVIVTPLTAISSNDVSFNIDNNIVIDNELIYTINENKIQELNDIIEERLESSGYDNVDIIISADLYSYELQIEKVFVDLSQVVINEDLANIDKYTTDIKNIIRAVLNVGEEDILIDGK